LVGREVGVEVAEAVVVAGPDGFGELTTDEDEVEDLL
jgi:hypothetical protein